MTTSDRLQQIEARAKEQDAFPGPLVWSIIRHDLEWLLAELRRSRAERDQLRADLANAERLLRDCIAADYDSYRIGMKLRESVDAFLSRAGGVAK